MRRATIALLALATFAVFGATQVVTRAAAGCADDSQYPGGVHPGGDWRSYGHDSSNTRAQPAEHTIGRLQAPRLAPAWTFSSTAAGGSGDFTGTPIVADGCVYAGSNDGWIFAMNADTGALVWKQRVPAGGGINSSVTVSGDGPPFLTRHRTRRAVSAPARSASARTSSRSTKQPARSSGFRSGRAHPTR